MCIFICIIIIISLSLDPEFKQLPYVYTYISGIAPITDGMATVIINGLECGTSYAIIAGGTLNGELVGPRSFLRNIIKSCLVTING